MKTIAFDARLVDHPGMGRYIVSLLEAMLSRETPYHFVLIGDPVRLKHFEKFSNVTLRACHVPIYSLEEQFRMNFFFEDADVVHVPHFNVPLKCPKNLVVTIHDLIYLFFRGYEPFPGAAVLLKWKLNEIARKARAVIAVSAATKDDCCRLFPGMTEKIRVVHEAADGFFSKASSTSQNSARKKFGLSDRYILSVGSVREHKNVQTLLAAYENLVKEPVLETDLVLVGRLDPRFDKKYALHERIQRLKGVRYLGKLGDQDVRDLYREAACFVMPSLYEGFGLPVLEAMACGAPVIISKASSLPEIAGEAALSFEPTQIDELKKLLYNVLTDNDLRQNLSMRGAHRASQFSWNKAALETLNIYREALA